MEALGARTLVGHDLEQGQTYWLTTTGAAGTSVSSVRMLQAYSDTVYYATPHAFLEDTATSSGATPEDYRHDQTTASTIWTINHNRGELAESVSVFVDSGGAFSPTSTTWANVDANTVSVVIALANTGYAIVEFPVT